MRDNARVLNKNTPIDFEDIVWLRRASHKSGADNVPAAVAEKLVAAGLIENEPNRPVFRITEKGRIALAKLG